MTVSKQEEKITTSQQRVLQLLFKFRFISTYLLAEVMGISRRGVYEVLETLVEKGYVEKVYEKDYRYARKPAYYYLNKQGVTTVRKLMDVKESVVHTLYKNDTATADFIKHCLTTARCYIALVNTLPADTDIFTKTEINQFRQFPKNRPDLYIRTPDKSEAMVVIVDDKTLYIVRKRLDEIIAHSEDEGWNSGEYPRICFVLRNANDKNSFLYSTNKKLESMGMDEDEIYILATHVKALSEGRGRVWSNGFNPKLFVKIFG